MSASSSLVGLAESAVVNGEVMAGLSSAQQEYLAAQRSRLCPGFEGDPAQWPVRDEHLTCAAAGVEGCCASSTSPIEPFVRTSEA